MSESAAGSESSSGGSVGKARNPATFTELLSRGGGIKRKRARVGKEQEEDIDSRIARLEAELANSASSSDSEGSEDEHDNNGELSAGSLEASEIVEKDGKLISALLVDKSARIQPLPPSMLPDPACGTRPPKGDVSSPPPDKKDGRNSQRPRVLSRPLQQTASGPKAQVQRGQGLEAAVRELQHTYEARSAERVPFYCRACKFQGSSVDDLAAHRQTKEHAAASDLERKASYCKMCRKQFTSPPQLREHVLGKQHRSKLESLREKQGRRLNSSSGR